MKHLSVIWILLFFFTLIAKGQTVTNIKYKDVFEVLVEQGDDKAYPLLKLHQQQDPYHVNTYYQLGVICLKWAKKYDPLTEFDNVKYFMYHANLYLTMASKYLDDKEARKNRDYYHLVPLPEGQKKLELVDIQKDINLRIEDANFFKTNILRIRKNYYNAVNNYNQCLELFLELNINNSKLKDVYLIANDTIIEKIEQIAQLYDSALIYFDAYKQAITDFPIKGYNQQYTLAEIETYKLHGLTNSNFLENEIQIWNYGQWVDEVLKIIHEEIKTLRNDIAITGKEINNIISVLNITKDYSTKYEPYALDKNLVYRIGKYDYKPMIIDLFNYQKSKIDYIIQSKSPLNNPDDTMDIDFMKRLQFLYQLVQVRQVLDKRAKALENNINDVNVAKYQDYIERNYNDKDGLYQYIAKEDEENAATFDASVNIVRSKLIDRHNVDNDELNFITYKKKNIPLFTTPVNFLTSRPGQYYTNQIVTDADGNNYISGFYKSENQSRAFVTRADSNGNVYWFHNFDFSTSANPELYNSGVLLELTEDGCMSIIHSTNNSPDSVYINNQIVRFDEKGKKIIDQQIGPSLIPTYLFFDDLNEKMLVAYKGVRFDDGNSELQELVIDFADSTGYTLWTTNMELSGDIVEIIRSNENFVLVANFSEMNIDGKNYKVSGNDSELKSNAFTAFIDENGNFQHIEVYQSKHSFFISDAVKLNSEVINLMGFETNVQDYSYVKNPDVKFVYKLIETSGKEFYNY